MSDLQPPPTFILPIRIDPDTKEARFEEAWLNWFLELVQVLNESGGLTLQHNLLGGLQGGTPTEYFHLTNAEHGELVDAKPAHEFYAGPASGADAVPLFRLLATSDLPAGTGTVTSVDVSGGTTGLTFGGGPITSSGTITMAGTLDVGNGGTGQTSYTNGQLLIGNTTGNTLTKATLTQGTGISITNGTGSITIASTALGDVVGPSSASDTAVALFDGTTGKLIKNQTTTFIDSSGRLLLGTATAQSIAGATPTFQMNGDTAATSFFSLSRYTANAQGAVYFTAKSRNATIGGHTVVQSGDTLGSFNFYGSDGTGFLLGGTLQVTIDGTPGTNDMPTRIQFSVTPDGSSSPVAAFRIVNSGRLQFDNASNFTANGTVATTMTSLGPTGANTTIQEWLTVQNPSGTVRYIPCF